jgi:ketosteroid isomerase-like protein
VTDPAGMLRLGLEAWNRGDTDGILELLDPDVEIHLSGAFPDLETDYRGHEGFLAFWRAMSDMWSPLELEPGEIEEFDGLLLSAVTFKGTGREGIRVERDFWFVWQFDDNREKAVAYSSHMDRESAVAAARRAVETGSLAA